MDRDDIFAETKTKEQLEEAIALQSRHWKKLISLAIPGIAIPASTVVQLPWSADYMAPEELARRLSGINFDGYIKEGAGLLVTPDFKTIKMFLFDADENPNAKKGGEKKRLSSSGATELFDIVESVIMGKRAEYMTAANKLIKIDENMATAGIRESVKMAMDAVDKIDKEKVSSEIKSSIELLRKNLDQFEADGAVGSLIVLARNAKRENQKLLIGLETDWIPGLNVKNSLQHQAISALMKEMDDIGKALESMGLDNVVVIRGNGENLANSILREADSSHTSLHNVVVMASASTINSEAFSRLKNAPDNDRPFLAGIDPAELIKLYSEYGEATTKQLYIKLTELLYMTLEIAAGKEPPETPTVISYDKKMRILILLPKATLVDYEKLKNAYKSEAAALQAA